MDQLQSAIADIRKNRPRNIAILTGAGISAESGIPTFRGAAGLWNNYRAEDLATPEAFARDPELVWKWYEWRRGLIREAEPNRAHRALADLEQRVASTVLVTQNVDGLHRRAGSRSILELHGSLFRTRCTREESIRERPDALEIIPPQCDCGALLRPDVVWFGEALDHRILASASVAVAAADLLLIIGTSALVYPAAGLINLLRHGSAIEINTASTPISDQARWSIRAAACDSVPPLVEAIVAAQR
jgi:NAD-dependent deacetylase